MKDIGQKGAVFGEYLVNITRIAICLTVLSLVTLCPVIASYIKQIVKCYGNS